MTDAEALDEIARRYRRSANAEWLFDDPSSTIEHIGDIVASTGRTVWVEEGEDA